MTVPREPSTELFQEPAGSRETAISCLARIGVQLGIDTKSEAVLSRAAGEGDRVTVSGLIKLADELGLHAEWSQLNWHELKATDFSRPLLIFRRNSDAVIVTGDGRTGAEEVSVWDPRHDGVIFYVPREEIKHTWNGHALIVTPKEQAKGLAPQSQQVRDAAVVSNTPDRTSPVSDLDVKGLQPAPVPVAGSSTADDGPKQRSPRPLVITASAVIVTIASIAIFFLVRVGPYNLAALHTAVREGANNPAQSQTEPGEMVTEGAIASASKSSTNKAVVVTAAPAPAAKQDRPAPDAASPPIALKSETDANAARPEPPAAAPVSTLPQTTAEGASSAPSEPSSTANPASVASLPAELSAASRSDEAAAGGGSNTAISTTASAHESRTAELAALLARGDALFSKGDLLTARLFYERAADGGNGQAALRLGETFDPVFLDQAHLRGARGDWSMALSWYRRARDLGVAEAEIMLKSLEAK
jgi:Peptidase C39 family